MASALPVVSSIVQLSKAAKRRGRYRRTAVVNAQHQAMRISDLLKSECPPRTERRAVVEADVMEASLTRLEMKIDSVIECLCRPRHCVASTYVADLGVPALKLQRQCDAARTIQRAWKRKHLRRSQLMVSSLAATSCLLMEEEVPLDQGSSTPPADHAMGHSPEARTACVEEEMLEPWQRNAFPVRCCKCRKALKDCSCEWELCQGATVILCDLKKDQDLNGELALVEKLASEDGRWSVRLQSGDGKRIKAKNMRADPREIVTEMFTDMEAALTKLDGILERLKSDARDAESYLAAIEEQKRALEEMSSCPAEMLSKAGRLLSITQSKVDRIHEEIEAVKAERATVSVCGAQAVTQLASKFMKHVESRES